MFVAVNRDPYRKPCRQPLFAWPDLTCIKCDLLLSACKTKTANKRPEHRVRSGVGDTGEDKGGREIKGNETYSDREGYK